jgi:predicted ribosome quality control (RQC) complex YloA/Tae2 family protein
MAFDAGMVSAIVNELNNKILNARVEKVNQPDKDVIVLLLHANRENLRLVLSCNSNNPHFNLTEEVKENPMVPPMFCMLLRKHLTGSRVISVTQLGFERAVEFAFACYDEMGFSTTKYLVAETMGKYSNVILLNSDKTVLNAIKLIDLASSSVRQILPGFPYELPPKQKKLSPLEVTREEFNFIFEDSGNIPADKFISSKFYGLSALTAREIVYRATGSLDVTLLECNADALWNSLSNFADNIIKNNFEPWIVYDAGGKPIEYSFFEPLEYGGQYVVRKTQGFGELLDEYFGKRDRAERIKQRTYDIFRLLTNAEARLNRKIELQEQDLAACADKDKYKLYADLITANIWQLSRGTESVELDNYYSESCEKIIIPLDKRLSPQQNAQRYYKKYNKSKTAEIELAKQLTIARDELAYIHTVFDSLTRAETENDILEIREELYRSGYASRMKNYSTKKLAAPKIMEFRTSGGFRVLCGKNNHQNDYITTKVASKLDYWFHVKNQPGSHCVLITNDSEPSEIDFTQAAIIAAFYSKASESQNVAVDYTLIKNIRKPAGAKPGFVTYTTNYTAYVTPNEKLVESLKVK